MVAGDLDGDGDMDMAITLSDASSVISVLNNGGGTFALGATASTGATLSARGASGARYAISGVPAIGYQRRVSVAPGVTAIKRSARGPHPYPYPAGYHVSRITTPWGSRVMKWTDGYAFPQPAPQGMR